MIFEWLKPVGFNIENLLSIPNTPKGYGPLLKI